MAAREPLETVMTFEVYVDPAWVGSTTPYRVRCGENHYGPMDLSDAVRQIRYSLAGETERRGVRAIERIRAMRQFR